jgi:hypothetical protein
MPPANRQRLLVLLSQLLERQLQRHVAQRARATEASHDHHDGAR